MLESVARLRKILLLKLVPFTECRKIKQSVFEFDEDLEITPAGDGSHVDFTYAGVRIRFSVVVGLEDGNARGNVICTQEYEAAAKPTSFRSGDFALDERGLTNFIEGNGKPYYVHEAADLINSHYLTKAFEHNLNITWGVQSPGL